jgi:Co/Zn/Cd efflux system component
LDGELKSRSNRIVMVILVFTMLQSYVQEVFENQEASRVAMAVVGIAALVATVVLTQMLRDQRNSGGQELKSGLSR